MSTPRFRRGDVVRLVDAGPAVGSKRRPDMPVGVDLTVKTVAEGGLRGFHLGIDGYPGLWREERFELVRHG